MFWKCAANLQKNTLAEVRFQEICKATLLLRHECSSVNLLHIFRTPFPKNTSEGLLLHLQKLFLSIILLWNTSARLKVGFCLMTTSSVEFWNSVTSFQLKVFNWQIANCGFYCTGKIVNRFISLENILFLSYLKYPKTVKST